MTRRIRLALAAGFVLVLAGATPVFAHSELVESDPADGATTVTPYTLTAAFTRSSTRTRSAASSWSMIRPVMRLHAAESVLTIRR